MVGRAGAEKSAPGLYCRLRQPCTSHHLLIGVSGGDNPSTVKGYPMNTALAFHEHQFNVVTRNCQIWLTSSDLAAALQYKNEKSITNLFNKNFDEFTAGMSEVIESVTSKNAETLNLSVSGNLRVRQRIFSLRGAHLIAMFARTPVAKEFRRWVLDVLDREVGSLEIIPVKPVVKTRREEIYYENDIPVARRPIGEGEILMNPDSCLEHVMRSGFVIIPCDEVGKLSLDELWLMAEETKKLRDRVRKSYQELAEKYDF